MALDKFLYHTVGYNYIGDTYIIKNMCYEYNTIEDFTSEMQKAINTLEGILKSTGGEFIPGKIFSAPLIFSGKVVIGSNLMMKIIATFQPNT